MTANTEKSETWTDRQQDLIDELRRLNELVENTPPSAQDMLNEGEFYPTNYNNAFGSWNEGVEAAGFEPRQQGRLSDEELLDGIRDLNKRVKPTPPTKDQMDEYGDYWGRSYRTRFGSWNEAVEEAGFTPRQKLENSRDRPDSCPLCEEVESGLDFHHWRYGEDEIGCYFCRECHDLIHEDDAKPTNSDWLIHAIENLVNHHISKQNPEPSVDEIVDRYNLPDLRDLVKMAINGEGIYQ